MLQGTNDQQKEWSKSAMFFGCRESGEKNSLNQMIIEFFQLSSNSCSKAAISRRTQVGWKIKINGSHRGDLIVAHYGFGMDKASVPSPERTNTVSMPAAAPQAMSV